MYIIAIGWLYVTILMAATESSITAGALTFFFYGLAPLALFLWVAGTPQRRRNQRARAAQIANSTSAAPQTGKAAKESANEADTGAETRTEPT